MPRNSKTYGSRTASRTASRSALERISAASFFLSRESPERSKHSVPICLLSHEYAACQDVGQAVAKAVREAATRALLVASTDMSHFISREEATAKDRKAIDAILALDAEGLHRVVRREGISMCGFHPTTAMLVAAKALGATRGDLVMYTDSGEVTRDLQEVVAYAGLVLR